MPLLAMPRVAPLFRPHRAGKLTMFTVTQKPGDAERRAKMAVESLGFIIRVL